MNRLKHTTAAKLLRKSRVRSKINGTDIRPRLSVTVSNLHVSAQVIDDSLCKTIVAATTVHSKINGTLTGKSADIGSENSHQK